ncbi:Calcium uptake protein 2 mitochondrial [Fasciola gigantica]|uniref:Calcium uptake protein 2 mitochondrial n=1 Tax=Fasciola gigantica TaxID=46835 RepID=A0A504Y8F2_FASGI|nr:Calcium uptake protein 2 mitochondrial [Fasciola gigantica]
MSWFTSRRPRWPYVKLGNFSPIFLSALAAGTMCSSYVFFKFPNKTEETKKRPIYHGHEKRFRNFASLQYKGVLFMTPADFINSLVKDVPTQHRLVSICKEDLDRFLKKTPSKNKISSNLFRQINDQGILSYSEYIFLLQVLTKPHSGFEIAFKMLDTDLSRSVDAQEFAKLNNVIAQAGHSEEGAPSDLSLPEEDVFRTTLMAHLFGRHHNSPLTYEEFIRFMQNVQTEALEVEFKSYSMGLPSIAPGDFAKIILRHTKLSKADREQRINRLQAKLSDPVPITFEDFQKFFVFLNCLDDFSMAMKLYTIAERPISLPEFRRAVKACTGFEMSSNLLQTVFALFDMDDDGRLSYPEFIQIMRERYARRTKARMVDDMKKSEDTVASIPRTTMSSVPVP